MIRALLIAAAVAAAAALLYAATLSQAGSTCEVCVRYGGAQTCRSAAAGTRAEAERMAQSTACALLAGGVTATLECQATPPLSVACEGP